MRSVNIILFPLDFARCSELAFEKAQFLAEKYDSELFVLHVLEAPSGAARLFNSFDEQEAKEEASAAIDDFLMRNGREGIRFTRGVEVGKPDKVIVETARKIGAGFVVMGSNGTTGLQERFIGSNAGRVIRSSSCPVITVSERSQEDGFKKILLPLDLTKETSDKVKWGIEFAKKFQSELQIVSVLQRSDSKDKAELYDRMNQAMQEVRSQGIEANPAMIYTREGIADAILKHGAEQNADLICIMTQQELSRREQFLGSNAERIVNHSRIPVMSINPVREAKTKVYASSSS